VFKLLDVHKIDLIQKSEIAFYLLQMKEHVFPDLELSKIPNFEQLQSDNSDVNINYLISTMEYLLNS